MTLFKKVFLIALTAQVAYWLMAALAFGKGQLIFHAATALVGATFLTKLLLQHRGKLKWLTIIVWPVLVAVCYEVISYWAKFINWTLDNTPFVPIWDAVRFLDMVVISIVIAYGVVLWPRWWHPSDNKK